MADAEAHARTPGRGERTPMQAPEAAAALDMAGAVSAAPPALPFEEEIAHPFATEPGDHAETPLLAYQQITPLLERLAK